MIKFLVGECGADLEVPSWQGLTPYQLAYMESTYNPHRFTDVANLLLMLGAESKQIPSSSDTDDTDSDFDVSETVKKGFRKSAFFSVYRC